jgi:hypothetical protein
MTRFTQALLFASTMLASGSALATACGGFPDVDDAVYPGEFCTSTEWVRNRGVTLGCAGGNYCPTDAVNRMQMALFMKRLGDVFTTKKFFTDLNPGVITIQNDAYAFVCPSASYTPAFLQTAVLHGLAWGPVTAPVTWSADIWASTDGGATFGWITNYIPSFGATAAGMTSGSTFARMNLNPGTSYIFAILIRESIDFPGGTGNFSDLACHLMVEIGNGAPLPATPPPCDGPNATCGDAVVTRGAGSLARNGQP